MMMDAQEHMRAAMDAAERVDFDADQGDQGDHGDHGDHGDQGDQGAGAVPPAPDPVPYEIGAVYPLNDYGNGQRLVHYFGQDMLYVPRLGWFRYCGKRWAADEDEITVRQDAQKISAHILGEVDYLALEPYEQDALDLALATAKDLKALDAKPPKDRAEADRARHIELREIADRAVQIKAALNRRKAGHRSHAKNSGNTSKISNMLQEARTNIARAIGDLNADPMMVNVENGTLHFKLDLDPHDAEWGDRHPKWTAALLPHDRGNLISKMMPVAYRPQAECPNWRAFLDTVQPDPDMQGFLQRFAGYCMTGLTREQKMVFNFGGGRNGKSTFVDTLARIFADYGTTVPIETLTGIEQRKGSDATPDLVRLPGARFVRASEPEQGTRMKEAMIKALTGGEAIMIRRMMQEFVEVTPEFKLMLSGNHKPEIRGSDDGIWRRLLLVPWEVQIAEADVDKTLPDRLEAEAEGILAWMVQGCIKYLQTGLEEPQAVRIATDEYRESSDFMRLFLQTECQVTGAADDFERVLDLSNAFNAWRMDRAESVWGRTTVSKAIKERAQTPIGPAGQMYEFCKRSIHGYSGIVLSDVARDRVALYGEELRAAVGRKS